MRDGITYNQSRDEPRLGKQHQDVLKVLSEGKWFTLEELYIRTGHPTPSISARIRDFRKERFGSMNIERQYISKGLWAYRLVHIV